MAGCEESPAAGLSFCRRSPARPPVFGSPQNGGACIPSGDERNRSQNPSRPPSAKAIDPVRMPISMVAGLAVLTGAHSGR